MTVGVKEGVDVLLEVGVIVIVGVLLIVGVGLGSTVLLGAGCEDKKIDQSVIVVVDGVCVGVCELLTVGVKVLDEVGVIVGVIVLDNETVGVGVCVPVPVGVLVCVGV